MKLADLQSRFQAAILEGGDAILSAIPDSPREKKEVLFGVYRDAYVLRLAGILREDFGRLDTYIGTDDFNRLAFEYIHQNPSHTPNARYYGHAFPAFVAEHPRYRETPMVAALARLEGTLNDVFDCADVEPLTLETLAAFAPETFSDLVFTPHPSAKRFDCAFNLDEIWTALSEERTPPPAMPLDEPQHYLVWRKHLTPYFRVLPPEAAMIWDELAKGVRFGVLCEMLAFRADADTAPARAAGHLQSMITDSLLAAVSE